MLFFRLGLKNAWRNITRSLLAIISMAFACAFLTYAFSLSRGYAAETSLSYRSILGGDVLAYEQAFRGDGLAEEAAWSYRRLGSSPFTDLEAYHPQLFSEGFLSGTSAIAAFDQERLSELAIFPGVREVSPRYQLPAHTLQRIGEQCLYRETPLRGRDPHKDDKLIRSPEEFLIAGRWFTSEDEGKPVAVVSINQHFFADSHRQKAQVGDTIELSVPAIRMIGHRYELDYEAERIVSLEIIGIIEVESRWLTWNDASGFFKEELYWILDEVQLPLSTWQALWDERADGPYRPEQVSLIMEDLAFLEDNLADLRQAFPQHSFISTVDRAHWAQMNRYNETYAVAAPQRAYFYAETPQTGSFSEDLRLPISVALLLNAALVIAANLLIMVSERKREVGILKAIGASRWQVILMVLAEAMSIACIGGVGGFLFMRIQSLLNQLSASIPIIDLVRSLLFDSALAMGAALIVSVVFGLLPALRMARLSAMEVLRND